MKVHGDRRPQTLLDQQFLIPKLQTSGLLSFNSSVRAGAEFALLNSFYLGQSFLIFLSKKLFFTPIQPCLTNSINLAMCKCELCLQAGGEI